MRISDWSSDVCSSDLDGGLVADAGAEKLAALHEIFHLRHVAADVPARFFLQRARIELQHQPVEPRRGEQMAFAVGGGRSEEHTSELQSLMRRSSAVFRLPQKTTSHQQHIRQSLMI